MFQMMKGNSVSKIGVIGTGVMGKGISQFVAQAGLTVILKSRTNEALNDAIKKIEERLLRVMSVEESSGVLNNILLTTDFSSLSGSDIIVESVIEDLDVKKQVFRELEETYSSEAILATNTSSLSITEISEAVSDPSRVVGIHFFNPVHAIELVEVIAGRHTSEQTVKLAKKFVNILNKKPIVLKDSPGFIVNRLLFTMINEAIHLLEEDVVSADDIDKAMRLGANHPMGPLALADLVGLDACLLILENLHNKIKNPKYLPSSLLRKKVKQSQLGRKTRKGFFEYSR